MAAQQKWLDAISNAFDASGLAHERNDEDGVITCGIASSEGADSYGPGYRIFVSVVDGVLLARLSSAYRVPLPSRPFAASALMFLNFQLQEGNLEMDVRDGEIRYRLSYPLALRPPQGAAEDAPPSSFETSLDIASLSKQLLRQATSHYPVAVDSLAKFVEASVGKEQRTTPDEFQQWAAKTVLAIVAEKAAADAR